MLVNLLRTRAVRASAVLVGGSSVAAGVAHCAAAPADEVPPFKMGANRYDQSTFAGRLAHFREVSAPRIGRTTFCLFSRHVVYLLGLAVLLRYSSPGLHR